MTYGLSGLAVDLTRTKASQVLQRFTDMTHVVQGFTGVSLVLKQHIKKNIEILHKFILHRFCRP